MVRNSIRTIICLIILFSGIDLYAGAGTALRFNGTNSFVNFPATSSINPFPLTVSTWFRSQNTSGSLQVIASKYIDSSYNGWALLMQGGALRGFYYRNGITTNHAIDAASAIPVNDGKWHHAALVIDATGGRLYLDGNLVNASAWN